MPPDDVFRLRHMREAARLAVGFADGRQAEDLERDPMLRLAVLHAVQIVGEAATWLSNEARAALPALDWPAIVGMRNRLVHAYSDIDAGLSGIR